MLRTNWFHIVSVLYASAPLICKAREPGRRASDHVMRSADWERGSKLVAYSESVIKSMKMEYDIEVGWLGYFFTSAMNLQRMYYVSCSEDRGNIAHMLLPSIQWQTPRGRLRCIHENTIHPISIVHVLIQWPLFSKTHSTWRSSDPVWYRLS